MFGVKPMTASFFRIASVLDEGSLGPCLAAVIILLYNPCILGFRSLLMRDIGFASLFEAMISSRVRTELTILSLLVVLASLR